MNKQALVRSATVLKDLFEKYSPESEHVRSAYAQCKPIIDLALQGEIETPGPRLPTGYFSTEFDLFELPDLFHAAAELDMWLSGQDPNEKHARKHDRTEA